MNTNPNALKVLCYGDSNTYGRNPSDGSRYDAATRWTGVLQDELGKEYYVIEEGLGGRTTNLDEDGDSVRKGFTYFKPCLLSHEPNVVIIMLGTNDVKDMFHRTAEDIVAALEEYLICINNAFADTKIILVSPTGADTNAPNFIKYAEYFSENAVKKAEQLRAPIEILARKHDALFFDASAVVTLGEEGLHWTKESHRKFAELLADKIKEEL